MSKQLKEKVAQNLSARIQNNWILGVGTGSTVDAAIIEIAKRVKSEKLQVACVPTSFETARFCEANGLTVLDAGYSGVIDFGFDGIDAIDKNLCAIKGKGGALLREKLLAVKCKHYVLIGDESKLVNDLAGTTVPVEVHSDALGYVERQLKTLVAQEIVLRQAQAKYGAVITERGNMILDVKFSVIKPELESQIKSIVGVVESGIFSNYANEALIACADQIMTLKK